MRPRWLIAIIPCIIVAILVMALGPWPDVVRAFEPDQPFEMVPLQTPEAASAALAALSDEARADYRAVQLWDIPFALANALAMLILLLVPARLIWRTSPLVGILAILPAIVVVGEAIENAGILSMLSSFADTGEADPTLAAVGTGIKFLVFMPAFPLILLLWIAALAVTLKRRSNNETKAEFATD